VSTPVKGIPDVSFFRSGHSHDQATDVRADAGAWAALRGAGEAHDADDTFVEEFRELKARGVFAAGVPRALVAAALPISSSATCCGVLAVIAGPRR